MRLSTTSGKTYNVGKVMQWNDSVCKMTCLWNVPLIDVFSAGHQQRPRKTERRPPPPQQRSTSRLTRRKDLVQTTTAPLKASVWHGAARLYRRIRRTVLSDWNDCGHNVRVEEWSRGVWGWRWSRMDGTILTLQQCVQKKAFNSVIL